MNQNGTVEIPIQNLGNGIPAGYASDESSTFTDPSTLFTDDRKTEVDTLFVDGGGRGADLGGAQPTQLLRMKQDGQESYDTCPLTVGWIVPITGPMKGASLTLKNGNNYVGRGTNNDCVLPADNGISAQSEVIISYVYDTHEYYVRPGADGHAVAYLNGVPLFTPMRLKAGDLIKLSRETTVRFVPFCFDSFCWSD